MKSRYPHTHHEGTWYGAPQEPVPSGFKEKEGNDCTHFAGKINEIERPYLVIFEPEPMGDLSVY